MSLRSSILVGLAGFGLGAALAAPVAADAYYLSAATRALAATAAQGDRYVTVRTSRRIAPPIRRSHWDRPPPGAYLVRDRYWLPNMRWKTDPYSRTVYAVYRGEVWFLDPVTGWAHTVDRYGRVYISDPRYRAVYSYQTLANWEGDLPYFFSYYAPDDGYYTLPRYTRFVEYYESPRYRYYDYPVAQDYWWDTYDDYYRSPSYVSNIDYVYYNDRNVRYDRHYRRDVYLGARGLAFLAPPPPIVYDGRSDHSVFLASKADAELPTIAATTAYTAPAPIAAAEVMSAAPAVEVPVAAALPVNAATVVAEQEAALPPPAALAQIESRTMASGEKPVSVTGDEIVAESAPPPATATPETAAQAAEVQAAAQAEGVAEAPVAKPADAIDATGGMTSTAEAPKPDPAAEQPASEIDAKPADAIDATGGVSSTAETPKPDPAAAQTEGEAVKPVEEAAPPESASTEIPPVDPVAPAIVPAEEASAPEKAEEAAPPIEDAKDAFVPEDAPGIDPVSDQPSSQDEAPMQEEAPAEEEKAEGEDTDEEIYQ